jgi:hypothetical protein
MAKKYVQAVLPGVVCDDIKLFRFLAHGKVHDEEILRYSSLGDGQAGLRLSRLRRSTVTHLGEAAQPSIRSCTARPATVTRAWRYATSSPAPKPSPRSPSCSTSPTPRLVLEPVSRRGASVHSVVKMSDVPITSPRRFGPTCKDAGQRSAESSLDNCYRDYAVNNAQQFIDLLSSANVPVAKAGG